MAQAQGTYGPSSVSQTNDPIIAIGYWKVKVTGANPTFAGGNCNNSITLCFYCILLLLFYAKKR